MLVRLSGHQTFSHLKSSHKIYFFDQVLLEHAKNVKELMIFFCGNNVHLKVGSFMLRFSTSVKVKCFYAVQKVY